MQHARAVWTELNARAYFRKFGGLFKHLDIESTLGKAQRSGHTSDPATCDQHPVRQILLLPNRWIC